MLGLEPPGCIYYNDIRLAAARSLQGIKYYSARIGARLVSYNIHAYPFPHILSWSAAAAENVCGSQQDLLTPIFIFVSQLGNAGSLARAVNAHHQDYFHGVRRNWIHSLRRNIQEQLISAFKASRTWLPASSLSFLTRFLTSESSLSVVSTPTSAVISNSSSSFHVESSILDLLKKSAILPKSPRG